MAAEGGLHRIENTLAAGASPKDAKGAVILVHGRGATPESMLPLAEGSAAMTSSISRRARRKTPGIRTRFSRRSK